MMSRKRKGGKRLNKRIAEQIRNEYKTLGLTQSELAEKHGVTRESINRIINNKFYRK